MKSATVYEQPYLSGDHFGLPRSTLVHRLANIAGVIHAGENCRIDAFVTITGDVTMGNNCHIGAGVAIYAAAGFTMGDGCALSPGSKVFTVSEDVDSGLVSSHAQSTLERAALAGPITFGKFVVIGANSVVLPGVTVGDQVQVGALSLVNRSLDGQGIYAGAPARFLRSRPPLKYAEHGRRVGDFVSFGESVGVVLKLESPLALVEWNPACPVPSNVSVNERGDIIGPAPIAELLPAYG